MKLIRNTRGFTLLEIVIVLTILGFLLAMIAPRLGTIGTTAVQEIDQSNIKDLAGFITVFQQQKNRLPNNLITVVNQYSPGDETSPGTFQMPLVDDTCTENGPETIGLEFFNRCQLTMHILSANEAAEIQKMGIYQVEVINDRVGSGPRTTTTGCKGITAATAQEFPDGDWGRPFNAVPVQAGLAVLMVGAGATSSDPGAPPELSVQVGGTMGNPEWLYRIVLGIGKDCSLVTGGVVQNEGLSPKGMQNSDYNTYINYCLVLPRLKSTVSRIPASGTTAIRFYDATAASDTDSTAQLKTITVNEAQALWQVVVCSPLGYTWPQDTVSLWTIDSLNP